MLNVIIHVVTVGTVVTTCAVTVTCVRRIAKRLARLIDIFSAGISSASIVAEQDRTDLRRLISDVQRGVAGVARLEAAGIVVAGDLADSHRRADETLMSDPPGTAADAASRQTSAEAARP